MRMKIIKKSLIAVMENQGIVKGSGSRQDYEQAKSLIKYNNYVPENYDEAIGWIIEFLNL